MSRLRTITLAVLTLLALGGFAAGAALVTDPTGARLRLTVEDLPGWMPVVDWFVPGIAIAALFGLVPAVTAALVFRWSRSGWTAAAAVGLLLVVWSVAQVFVIGFRLPLIQAGLLVLGIVLTGLGIDGGTQADADDESRAGVRS